MCVSIWAISTRAELGVIMLAASACLIAVTVAGLVAGVRLLPRGRLVWFGAVGAALAMGVVLLFSGVFLAVPGLLSLAALLYTARGRPTHTWAEAEPASEMNDGPTTEPHVSTENTSPKPPTPELTRRVHRLSVGRG